MDKNDDSCIIYPNGVYSKIDTLLTVVEMPFFLNDVGSTITEAERDELIIELAKNPSQGDEIQGTGGLRKLRWQSQGKGKRGGLRIIYFFYNHTAPVFLMMVYKKSEQENLSPQAQKLLAQMVQAIKKNLKAKSRGIR